MPTSCLPSAGTSSRITILVLPFGKWTRAVATTGRMHAFYTVAEILSTRNPLHGTRDDAAQLDMANVSLPERPEAGVG